MFYLKYRPTTISQLDNEKAKKTISQVLKTKQLPHAYLFVGQKGTGKTSTARIFAKSINCLNNTFAGKSDSIEPCNECKNCISIQSGTAADVTEMDAASNRGIEEIRSLIRESIFTPLSCRYRVFIIDEAHMITNEGFNALLKTLEEPPGSVMFILATTNEEKVPKTIISRCFKVVFGTAIKEDVKNMLQRITKGENISIDKEILEIVANNSDRSFRDAARILEELVIQQALTPDQALTYLGIRTKSNLLKIMQDKPVKDALLWIKEFSDHGGSTKLLIEELLGELRSVLLTKNGVKIDDAINLDFTIPEIARLMKLFQEAYTLLKNTPIESVPLEIAVVEFYNGRK